MRLPCIIIKSIVENRTGDMPIFITDSRQVIAATGWQPQRNGKTLIKDIFDWISHNEKELKGIF
jgi:CDP-paratose 2-epimerase